MSFLFVICLVSQSIINPSQSWPRPDDGERALFRSIFSANGPILAYDEILSGLKQLGDIYTRDKSSSNESPDEDKKLVMDLIDITQMLSCTEENSRKLQQFIKQNIEMKRSRNFYLFVDYERRRYNKTCLWL